MSCAAIVCASFALERENILHLPIVMLRPDLRVRLRIDELRVDPHAIARDLHAAFEHIRDAEFASDLLHVARLAAVSRHAAAADHFQISHPSQIRQDVVLHAVGEIRRRIVIAQTSRTAARRCFSANRTTRSPCARAPSLDRGAERCQHREQPPPRATTTATAPASYRARALPLPKTTRSITSVGRRASTGSPARWRRISAAKFITRA